MRRLWAAIVVAVLGALLVGSAQARMPKLTTARAHGAIMRYGRLDDPLSVHVGQIVRIDRQIVEAILTEYGEPIGRDPFTGALIRFHIGFQYPIVAMLQRVRRSAEARRYDPYDILVYTYHMRGSGYYERF